ncbi:hypothetical protein cyc_01613 [Cyclospora cayetanensis]|uniref:Uncharacterized protein n=1 Tax=Cyclospora cayetanensis TaxID=88456 RepID=A0A1D3D932_9EIME|nr:hypothetical protein cyc_01613 [Cyclospora cayetanensis]
MPLSVDGASSELYPDASRSVPRPGASGLQVIPKSSCASKEDPQSGGLVDEIAGSQGHQRAFRTPTWEKQTGQPVAKAGSPLSPQSPHASVRLVGASTAASKSTTERAMRPIPCRSEEKQKDEWMLQHEAHLELLHRQAAARLIQHAWRQHRLGVLFSSVLQMKRRRAESARNRRRSNGLVPFTEKTSEALSRTVELSASLGPRGSQDDITEVQQRRDLYEQFIPIIEENKPPAPVVLFKAGSKNLLSRHLSAEDPKRAEGPSHKAKEKAANQEASEKPRASTEFLQDISDSGSPRNNQSERFPEIVLQLASSSSSSPKRSSHSSDSSSQRSSSDLSRSSSDSNSDFGDRRRDSRLPSTLEDEIGRSGKHEYDDFDVRKRLRQIMREGLDSRMRSTLAGSDVLLPRASRIGWTSSPSQKEQYMPAIAGLGVQNALSKRSDRQKYSLSKIGTQRSVVCAESLKTETKSPGQKDMKNVSQDRRKSHLNVFLHPDWQERKLESLNALRALPPTKALEKKASRPPPVSVSRADCSYCQNKTERADPVPVIMLADALQQWLTPEKEGNERHCFTGGRLAQSGLGAGVHRALADRSVWYAVREVIYGFSTWLVVAGPLDVDQNICSRMLADLVSLAPRSPVVRRMQGNAIPLILSVSTSPDIGVATGILRDDSNNLVDAYPFLSTSVIESFFASEGTVQENITALRKSEESMTLDSLVNQAPNWLLFRVKETFITQDVLERVSTPQIRELWELKKERDKLLFALPGETVYTHVCGPLPWQSPKVEDNGFRLSPEDRDRVAEQRLKLCKLNYQLGCQLAIGNEPTPRYHTELKAWIEKPSVQKMVEEWIMTRLFSLHHQRLLQLAEASLERLLAVVALQSSDACKAAGNSVICRQEAQLTSSTVDPDDPRFDVPEDLQLLASLPKAKGSKQGPWSLLHLPKKGNPQEPWTLDAFVKETNHLGRGLLALKALQTYEASVQYVGKGHQSDKATPNAYLLCQTLWTRARELHAGSQAFANEVESWRRGGDELGSVLLALLQSNPMWGLPNIYAPLTSACMQAAGVLHSIIEEYNNKVGIFKRIGASAVHVGVALVKRLMGKKHRIARKPSTWPDLERLMQHAWVVSLGSYRGALEVIYSLATEFRKTFLAPNVVAPFSLKLMTGGMLALWSQRHAQEFSFDNRQISAARKTFLLAALLHEKGHIGYAVDLVMEVADKLLGVRSVDFGRVSYLGNFELQLNGAVSALSKRGQVHLTRQHLEDLFIELSAGAEDPVDVIRMAVDLANTLLATKNVHKGARVLTGAVFMQTEASVRFHCIGIQRYLTEIIRKDLVKETPESVKAYLNALFATLQVAKISEVNQTIKATLAKNGAQLDISCPFMNTFIDEEKTKERQTMISMAAIGAQWSGTHILREIVTSELAFISPSNPIAARASIAKKLRPSIDPKLHYLFAETSYFSSIEIPRELQGKLKHAAYVLDGRDFVTREQIVLDPIVNIGHLSVTYRTLKKLGYHGGKEEN